jgi:hypothetical protein
MTTVRELWPSATLRTAVADRRCGKARNILDKSFHPTTRDQSIAGIRIQTTGTLARAAIGVQANRPCHTVLNVDASGVRWLMLTRPAVQTDVDGDSPKVAKERKARPKAVSGCRLLRIVGSEAYIATC